ncbi:hypothetical protein FJ365_05450 [Candidatus Dependentiae bacterium]|nr:hypothetical protein [Candidatus Dependentiae bacterium]
MKIVQFLLVLGMCYSALPLCGSGCPKAGRFDEPSVGYRIDEIPASSCCLRTGERCARFLRRPAVRCALRCCCISTIFLVGFFLHVDLLNLMNTNIDSYNNLMTFLWPDANEEKEVAFDSEQLTVDPSSSVASQKTDDQWVILLLRAQFPDICDDLQIREGEPIPERAKAMFRFFTSKPKPQASGRGCQEDESAKRARLADSIQQRSWSNLRAFSATFALP